MNDYRDVIDAKWFYDQIRVLDFNLIGLPYQPLKSGVNLAEIENSLDLLAFKIILAETAYSFILEWNDWTNNIIASKKAINYTHVSCCAKGAKLFSRKD